MGYKLLVEKKHRAFYGGKTAGKVIKKTPYGRHGQSSYDAKNDRVVLKKYTGRSLSKNRKLYMGGQVAGRIRGR